MECYRLMLLKGFFAVVNESSFFHGCLGIFYFNQFSCFFLSFIQQFLHFFVNLKNVLEIWTAKFNNERILITTMHSGQYFEIVRTGNRIGNKFTQHKQVINSSK